MARGRSARPAHLRDARSNDPGFAHPLIDKDDPALKDIVVALFQMRQLGFDVHDDAIVAQAVEAGRRMYREGTGPRAVAQQNYNERQRYDAAQRRAEREKTWTRVDTVYYMRIGNRVKIGFTTDLDARLAAINPEELMVTEPGTRMTERRRHDQFAELRTHGEWFRLEGDLAQHIDALQAAQQNDDEETG